MIVLWCQHVSAFLYRHRALQDVNKAPSPARTKPTAATFDEFPSKALNLQPTEVPSSYRRVSVLDG